MDNTYHMRIGGPQGSGIDRVASLLARACVSAGGEVLTRREYHSNIIGRHSYVDIALWNQAPHSVQAYCDLLVSYDAETLFRHIYRVNAGGLVIYDPALESASIEKQAFLDAPLRRQLEQEQAAGPTIADILASANERGIQLLALPCTDLLKQLAKTSDLSRGEVKRVTALLAMAAVAAHIGLPVEVLYATVDNALAKHQRLLPLNHRAIEIAYQQVKTLGMANPWPFPAREVGDERLLVNATDSVALGKLAAGLDVQTYYPISPATDESTRLESIGMVTLQDGSCYQPRIVQMEDEIASISAAAGAALAGARTSTSTSGPGLSLMSEALGWTGMTEVPLVISHYMRGGPSTGMPTRTDQGDLLFAIHAGHGEFPRIVIASGDVEDAFYDSMQAFNYAERFRLPVIHLLDKHLTATSQSVKSFDTDKIAIEHSKLIDANNLTSRAAPFTLNKDAVSPRPLVGQAGNRHWLTAVEHSPDGLVCEDPQNREAMMEHRMLKLKLILDDVPMEEKLLHLPANNAVMTLLGWGSVKGAMLDARQRLAEQGIAANILLLRLLCPFPAAEVQQCLQSDVAVVVIENSFSGQLDVLMRQHLGQGADHIVVKYSGRPFTGASLADVLMQITDGQAQPRMVLRDPYE
ncbi:2-oxoacid:acceptor oxidoreductase subunit alpha [Pseudomonadota bacterium]|jgi:2-oxoglutarate ferredoxin oxidoreductase subunit alpha